jgi:cell division protein FtsB
MDIRVWLDHHAGCLKFFKERDMDTKLMQQTINDQKHEIAQLKEKIKELEKRNKDLEELLKNK